MAAVSYNGALTTGHGPYPPTQIKSSQTKFFVGGIPALVAGDLANNHGHTPVGACISTTTKFFVSGKAIVRIGDPLTDGDTVAQGSPKVFVN
ncbi:PAAR domain-containing protein [Acinetobacter baumannii]